MADKRYKLQINTDAEIEVIGRSGGSLGDLECRMAGVPGLFTVPAHWLKEIPPPTPAEPEPGLYRAGDSDVLLYRSPHGVDWFWVELKGESGCLPWAELFRDTLPEDVDIVPLVAKPEPYDDHTVDETALADWERELLDKQARVVEAERAVVTAAKAWRKRMEGPISHGQLAGSTPQTRALVAAVDALSAADRAEAGE